jgi:hypothetical protein
MKTRAKAIKIRAGRGDNLGSGLGIRSDPDSILSLKLMDEMGLYSQVARPFMEASADRSNREEVKGKHPFYGTPEFRYYTADYIEIPSLEEFISELVTHVQV